jgi:lauroyl/myristoyl acyltransferase
MPWKNFRFRIEELACLALAAWLPRLSRQGVVKLANALGGLAFALDRRGRAVALDNLECALGDAYTVQDRVRIARESYRNFVRTMVDLFWIGAVTPVNYHEFMTLEGSEELLARGRAEGRGIAFMTIHQGNWEWSNLAAGFKGIRNVTVAENFKNPRLTAIFRRLREHSGPQIIPQESSIVRLLKTVKRGGTAAMLIDLNIPPTQAAMAIDAFGLKMCVPLLHAVLAQRANAMLVPGDSLPSADGSCRIVTHPPLEFSAGASTREMVQGCWDFFEPRVRERPELWLWAYKHFRYRPRDATRRYPAYANESAKFEKLLKSAGAGEPVDKPARSHLHTRP